MEEFFSYGKEFDFILKFNRNPFKGDLIYILERLATVWRLDNRSGYMETIERNTDALQ